MSTLPKISIVTASYNQGQYIEDTIQSVVGQGYPNLEYIIIDGGSTDNSVEIIKKYQDQITYWVSEPDNGQSDAINKGLRRATGDIVAWLNSDDIFIEGSLQAMGEAFANNTDVDIVYGDVVNFLPDGTKRKVENHFEPLDFMTRVSIHQPGVFWKKQLNEQHGYLDESFFYLMDYELWMRIFWNAKSLRIEKEICLFREHDNAKTSDNPQGLYDDYRRVISRFANSIPNTFMKQRMQELGLYFNDTDVRYRLSRTFTDSEIHDFLEIYLFNCAVQEYTRGHIGATNKLITRTLSGPYLAEKIKVLLKNNSLNYFRKAL